MSCVLRSGTDRQTVTVLRVLCLLYVMLIVHCSLMPWTGWRVQPSSVWSFLSKPILHGVSRSDAVANVLAYIPLGGLLVSSLRRKKDFTAVLLASIAGTALSFTMETLQWYPPSRSADPIDIITNGTGTLAGALLVVGCPRLPFAARLIERVNKGNERLGPLATAGLGSVALWLLSELTPFTPVLHRARLQENLLPAWQLLQGARGFRLFVFTTYALYMAGAMLVIALMHRKAAARVWVFPALAGGVLLIQPFIHRHVLSLEAIAGVMVGALIYSVVCNLCDDKAPVLAMLSLVLGFVAYELEPKPGALTAFNWMPFYAQNEVRLTSFGNILAVSWPFLALGCVAVLISSPRTRMAVFGAFAVAVLVFALESAQLYIPGRYGDITTVLLAVGAWSLPWFLAREALAQPEEQPSNHAAEAFIASASTPVPHVICCDGQHAK